MIFNYGGQTMINQYYKEIKNNLTKESLKILLKLNLESKLRFTELKDNVGISNVTLLYREIARLEGACLIVKTKDKSNYKATYYSITEHGLNVISK